MKSTTFLVSLGILAAAISTPLLACDQEHSSQRERRHVTDKRTVGGFDHGMQEVRHDASPATPGSGWRYFSDPATRRAVVISPQGDYYYSRGQGLNWVAAEPT
ncbi:MAG: hypothetical protein ABI893_14105 [Polaromonas sp.]|uniref:hypothetical protein n=1 Tax=Polaromonas sp. TaxID=1869339 RepID=UPI00326417C1